MKTLIIKYLPREERSKTKQVLDAFLKNATGEIEELDLTKDIPDLLLQENLAGYYKRNYGGEELNETEAKSLAKMDKMTEQFLNADKIVLAYPMYNFSLPAAVKAYFDSVLQKNKTWDIDNGNYVGLMHGKNALIITSAGGKYPENSEHSTSLSKTLFKFVGIEAEVVEAHGMGYPDAEDSLVEAKAKAESIAKNWY
jgi:FMN-dependent NADH-azoreductase